MRQRARLDAYMEERIPIYLLGGVILAGLAVGAGLYATTHGLLDADSSQGPDRTAVIETNITVASSTDWRQGKSPDGVPVIADGNLRIPENRSAVEFWESRTFQAENVSTLRVVADIPAPLESPATARVITSDIPDFGDKSGNYRRTGEQVFSLKDGLNVFEVKPLPDPYYRIHFSLQRDSVTTPTPRIKNYTVTVLEDKNKPLFPSWKARGEG